MPVLWVHWSLNHLLINFFLTETQYLTIVSVEHAEWWKTPSALLLRDFESYASRSGSHQTRRIKSCRQWLPYITSYAGRLAHLTWEQMDSEDNNYTVAPGSWRQQPTLMVNLQPSQSRNASNQAKDMRKDLANYFQTRPREVSWQMSYVHNTHSNMMRNISTAPQWIHLYEEKFKKPQSCL